MPTSQDDATLPQATMENLETVLRMREEAWRHRSLGEKLADMVGRFVGRGSFVLLQLLILLVWAAFNTPLIRGLPVFDPYPFNLLGVLVSFEAVVITVFVLIKQNRMSLMDERRAHLELQITLLTEKRGHEADAHHGTRDPASGHPRCDR